MVPKKPTFDTFCDFGGAKMACYGLQKGSFHLFAHSRVGVGRGKWRPRTRGVAPPPLGPINLTCVFDKVFYNVAWC